MQVALSCNTKDGDGGMGQRRFHCSHQAWGPWSPGEGCGAGLGAGGSPPISLTLVTETPEKGPKPSIPSSSLGGWPLGKSFLGGSRASHPQGLLEEQRPFALCGLWGRRMEGGPGNLTPSQVRFQDWDVYAVSLRGRGPTFSTHRLRIVVTGGRSVAIPLC